MTLVSTENLSIDTSLQEKQRLLSLDFMRGFIMVLLMLEGSRLFDHLLEWQSEGLFHNFMLQFTHHPWHGLRFWDLIQPGFMFIAGTALAFSIDAQQRKGIKWKSSFYKVVKRSGWLFFWGVLDYAVRPSGLSFELWDVLTQLSFTTIVTFLVIQWPVIYQLALSAAILLLTEFLYRFTNIPGFDQPFTDQHNFGNYVDLLLMNKINTGGWVAINCIPTAVHTLWGAMVGRVLLSTESDHTKIKKILVGGVIALCIGILLDYTTTPVIKRIATSSFVCVSGGYCLIGLAFLYWWIDILKHRRFISFFLIVGMNSLFIYLFFEIVGSRWFNGYIEVIVEGLIGHISGITSVFSGIIASMVIFLLEWKMCEFLYRKHIFFKI
ncbi:DUF5009 domain-containing protein [Cytophagaceae bacterium DM2B3-1]|uniref:DUF5009 domain-containing protein n=1 Tax=Xanthocytophaga flava TaxID=3048013 RepID=A0ABT7CF95_9BACT|nr:DUF5009 domain-containing protein [Xanthocytophaga flavus]MDJ1472912.1 DUF5009 domain-containing protein [Xanthocytophaga flavus]MDJ1492409.1 DUF5009 domain-containing protein [Xanthocytophaga flavus]